MDETIPSNPLAHLKKNPEKAESRKSDFMNENQRPKNF